MPKKKKTCTSTYIHIIILIHILGLNSSSSLQTLLQNRKFHCILKTHAFDIYFLSMQESAPGILKMYLQTCLRKKNRSQELGRVPSAPSTAPTFINRPGLHWATSTDRPGHHRPTHLVHPGHHGDAPGWPRTGGDRGLCDKHITWITSLKKKTNQKTYCNRRLALCT